MDRDSRPVKGLAEARAGRVCMQVGAPWAPGRARLRRSQIQASSADVLLLTWKPAGGQRGWLVAPVSSIRSKHRTWLRVRNLRRTPQQLKCKIEGFGRDWARSGAGLRAEFAALFPV